MIEPTPDEIMADIEAHLKTVLEVDLADRVTYPPPDQAPGELAIWLDYGPVSDSASHFTECVHTVVATVAVPNKGAGYPALYRTVTNVATKVRHAMRTNATVADEATVMSAQQGRAYAATYAGVQNALVVATVTWQLETKGDAELEG